MRFIIVDGCEVEVKDCNFCPCFSPHPTYVYEGMCRHPAPGSHIYTEFEEGKVPSWCPLREVVE